MKGKPDSAYLPGPVCSGGHKRTKMNTGWVHYKIRGKVYLYARCKVCMANKKRVYYARSRREREARGLERYYQEAAE